MIQTSKDFYTTEKGKHDLRMHNLDLYNRKVITWTTLEFRNLCIELRVSYLINE